MSDNKETIKPPLSLFSLQGPNNSLRATTTTTTTTLYENMTSTTLQRSQSLLQVTSSKDADVLELQKRWDGLLPNHRSALERKESFRLRKQSSVPSCMAFSFCDNETSVSSTYGDFEDDDESFPDLTYSELSELSTFALDDNAEQTLALAPTKTTLAPAPRKVTFSEVMFHYHETILGDSPFVSSGAPLALGWTRTSSETFRIHAYEASKRVLRATSSQLKLSPGMRQRILRQSGVSQLAILQRTEMIDDMRHEIKQNIRRVIKERRRAPQRASSMERVRRFWRRLIGQVRV